MAQNETKSCGSGTYQSLTEQSSSDKLGWDTTSTRLTVAAPYRDDIASLTKDKIPSANTSQGSDDDGCRGDKDCLKRIESLERNVEQISKQITASQLDLEKKIDKTERNLKETFASKVNLAEAKVSIIIWMIATSLAVLVLIFMITNRTIDDKLAVGTAKNEILHSTTSNKLDAIIAKNEELRKEISLEFQKFMDAVKPSTVGSPVETDTRTVSPSPGAPEASGKVYKK